MRKPMSWLERGMQVIVQSVLQTAGTSCAKVKDPNSNFAENNIKLCVGYIKTYKHNFCVCEGLLKQLPTLSTLH